MGVNVLAEVIETLKDIEQGKNKNYVPQFMYDDIKEELELANTHITEMYGDVEEAIEEKCNAEDTLDSVMVHIKDFCNDCPLKSQHAVCMSCDLHSIKLLTSEV